MSIWLHTAILATGFAATAAVGLASAALYEGVWPGVGAKADRLAIATSDTAYTTVETRSDGISELRRIPLGAEN